jgi:hypothetical protein
MVASAVHKCILLRTAQSGVYLIENTGTLERHRRKYFRTLPNRAEKESSRTPAQLAEYRDKCVTCSGLRKAVVL